MRDEGVRELMGISVFLGFATVIYKTRFIYGPLRVHNPFRVCSQFFLNTQNATFIKKLCFEFTKRKSWLSFFQNALFGLKKPKQTGTKIDTTQCCLIRKTQGLAREKFKYINLFSKQVKLKPKFRLNY